jgi:hypothetical protein
MPLSRPGPTVRLYRPSINPAVATLAYWVLCVWTHSPRSAGKGVADAGQPQESFPCRDARVVVGMRG